MKWEDEGIVLSARPHGESSAIVHLLTKHHGRHAGLVRGGQGSRARGLLQPGNQVNAVWSGRLPEHLGSFLCELQESHAARVLDDAGRLAALSSAAAVTEQALPEREPHPGVFQGFLVFLEHLEGPHWAEVYVRWEMAILADLGFGLDLSACAATGETENLAYVSPKSGRAVTQAAGEAYKERLMVLPGFLAGRGGGGPEEVGQGLAITGFFLERHLFHSAG